MAFDVGAITGKIVLDTKGWTNSVKAVQVDLKGLNNRIQQNASSLRQLGAAFLVVGTSLTLLSRKFVKTASDVQESENLFREALEGMADDAIAWSNTLSDSLDLNRFEIRKTVGTFNLMLKSMGIMEKDAFKMSTALTQLGLDLASLRNLRTEEAFLKLQSAIAGEAEPLKRIGILVNDNTIKTWALNNSIIKQGQVMTETQKIYARFGVILEATTKDQGDMARTMNDFANVSRRASALIGELSAQIGAALIPAITKILLSFISLIKLTKEFVKENQELTKTIVLLASGLGALAIPMGTLLILLPTISSALTILAAKGIALTPIFLSLAGAIVAVTLAFQHWDTLQAIFFAFSEGVNNSLSVLTRSLGTFLEQLEKIPFVGDKFAGLGRNLNEVAKEFSINADVAKQKLDDLFSSQKNNSDELKVKVTTDFEEMNIKMSEFYENMKKEGEAAKLKNKETFDDFLQTTKTNFNFMLEFGKSIFNSMGQAFGDLFYDIFTGNLDDASDVFENFGKSILRGLSDIIGKMIAMKVLMSAIGGMSGFFGGGAGGAGTVLPSPGATGFQPISFTPITPAGPIPVLGPTGGFAVGTTGFEVPQTGLIKVHQGENVDIAPRYDSEQKKDRQSIEIYNLITPEAVASSLRSKEGENVIVNIIDRNSLRNGPLRDTFRR